MKQSIRIPPEEFGPGSKFDFANNRLIGASGTIYENIQLNADDVYRIFSFGQSREEFDAFLKSMRHRH